MNNTVCTSILRNIICTVIVLHGMCSVAALHHCNRSLYITYSVQFLHYHLPTATAQFLDCAFIIPHFSLFFPRQHFCFLFSLNSNQTIDSFATEKGEASIKTIKKIPLLTSQKYFGVSLILIINPV